MMVHRAQRPGLGVDGHVATYASTATLYVDAPVWLAVGCPVLGITAVLRSALIVAARAQGRFPGDPWLTLAAGFGLLYLGQHLINQ